MSRSRTFIFILGLLSVYYVIQRYPFNHPLSAAYFQLSPTTQSLLTQLSEPIECVLYSTNSEQYHETALLMERYQRIHPFFHFRWEKKDYPYSEQYHSEVLEIKYRHLSERVDLSHKPLNEAMLTQQLFRMQRQADSWIVFLQQHGEPELFGEDKRHFTRWHHTLKNQGLWVQPLSLTKTPLIADNVSVLVMAGVRSALLPEEEQIITDYLKKGGSLLWLMDPFSTDLPFLERYFNVERIPGAIVDAHAQALGTPHPAITLIDTYSELPFSPPHQVTVFPWSCALKVNASSWKTTPLLTTHKSTWSETGPSSEDIDGPLTLGVLLTKPHPLDAQLEQRVVIIGNTRFLSNGVIENYGNLGLGQQLINWLHHDDALLTIEQPTVNDRFTHLHLFTAYLIEYGFPGVSCIIIIIGIFYSIKRHKAFVLKTDSNIENPDRGKIA